MEGEHSAVFWKEAVVTLILKTKQTSLSQLFTETLHSRDFSVRIWSVWPTVDSSRSWETKSLFIVTTINDKPSNASRTRNPKHFHHTPKL